MKRILAMMTAALIVASMMAVTAFAADDEGTVCDPSEVHGGEKVTIDTYYFVYTDKDGTEYRLDDSLDVDYYSKVTPTWKKNGSMVEQVYYNDGDSYVTLVIKAGINTSVSKNIIGQLKIRDTEARRNYVCKIEEGDLVVKGIDEIENMYEDGDKEFSLPWDYQTKKVRFVTDDGAKYGTFTAEFDNDEGDHIAKFVTKVVDQSALYLGFNETENIALMKKFPDANMRFINWTRPKFELKGKLSIYMESDEYIYGINTDDTLYRLGGTWDSDNDAYVISTDTLGSYVISDTQLVKTGSSGGTTTTPPPASSTAPKPSSTTPKPSSSVAPPPSSSVAPPPSSSVAPPPSSSQPALESSSSEPAPESSDPPDVGGAAPDPQPSRPASTTPDDDDDEDEDDEDEDEKKGLPIIPVLLGVLILVVVVCTIVVLGNQGGGRQRKKRFDDWDD